MAIPLYQPQISPPHKPSRRDLAGVEARAKGEFAGQAGQTAATLFGFAGKLFEVANRNQVNQGLVKARDGWRSFWSELQRDPDYASYGQKFDTFYQSLRENVQKEAKLPRARKDLELKMEGLRGDWADSIQKLSDDRAINHARTVRIQGINQAVQDQDPDRVLTQLRESGAAGEFEADDLAKLKDTALREVLEGQTMAYARLLGDKGMLWLMSDEAQEKFALELGPEERYFLDSEKRQAMAVQLSNERANRAKAEEAADWKRRKVLLDFAREQIQAGNLLSAEQLYEQDMQARMSEKGITEVHDEDRQAVDELLADRAAAAEKDRESYSNEILDIIEDAIKAGDATTAERYLMALIDGGYALDAMGRLDPDVLRYQEQLKRISGGEGLTGFDRDANALRAKLRAGTLSRQDLAEFLQKHPDKEGRVEHDKMWNELQQQANQRDKRREESQELAQANYNEYFWQIFGAEGVSDDELEKLDRWRYRNYPRNERDRSQPGIRESTWVQWGKLIADKREELKKGDLRGKQLGMGEERIKTFWKARTKDWEGETSKRAARLLAEAQNKRDGMLLEFFEAMKDPAINPVEKAQELINAAAGIEVEAQFGAQYKKSQAEIQLEPTVDALMRHLAIRREATAEEAAPAPEAEVTYRGQRFAPAQTRQQVAVANARRRLAGFTRYAKYEDGNLVIRRNKKTGQLDLFDMGTRLWVKADEAQLRDFAAALSTVQHE